MSLISAADDTSARLSSIERRLANIEVVLVSIQDAVLCLQPRPISQRNSGEFDLIQTLDDLVDEISAEQAQRQRSCSQ